MTSAVGLPAEAVAQVRRSPAWPALEALAITIVYDGLLLLDPALRCGRSWPRTRGTGRPACRRGPPGRYRTLIGGLHTVPAIIAHPGRQSGG
jgi:hypothetical protein